MISVEEFSDTSFRTIAFMGTLCTLFANAPPCRLLVNSLLTDGRGAVNAHVNTRRNPVENVLRAGLSAISTRKTQ